MLNKIIYQKTTDLYYTKFLSNQQGTLVVPDPQLADLWREQLLLAKIELVTLTYADWIELLKETYLDVEVKNTSKSELLDIFHRVWHNCQGPKDFLLFQKVFEIYTDIKSYTSDVEIFRQILSQETSLGDQVKSALSVLFSIENEILDEYRILRILIDEINAGNKKKELAPFHLIGFKVLSSLQLSLLDALAVDTDVNVHLSKYLDDKVSENQLTDWPFWLKPDKVHTVLSHEAEKKNHLFLCSPGDYTQIWQDSLGSTVTILDSEDEFPLISYGQQHLPNSGHSTSDVGSQGISVNLKKIHDELINGKKSWKQISYKVNEMYELLLKEKNNYGALKWAQYLKKWFLVKLSEIDGTTNFDWMDFNVLQEKMTLDATRLNWVQDSNSKNNIKISILEKDIYFYPVDKNYLIVDESKNVTSRLDNKYSTSSLAILKSLGPMMSDGWSQLYFEATVLDFLGQSKTTQLFLSKDVLDIDLFWKELIKQQKFEIINLNIPTMKSSSDLLQTPMSALKIIMTSPSALLTYKNCPRQYFANYIQKLQLNEDEEFFITESKKGEMYHQTLQDIGENKELLIKLTNSKEELKIFLISRFEELKTNEAILEEMAQVLIHTFQYWIQMPFWTSSWESQWETKVEDEELSMKGRIDFVAYQKESKQLLLIDFKKSNTPTAAEIIRFDHWQIASYLYEWKKNNPSKIVEGMVFGYWNLSDVEESTMLHWGEVKFDLPISTKLLKEDVLLWESQFKEIWLKVLDALRNDNQFIPRPLKAQICNYCSLKTTCPKGQL